MFIEQIKVSGFTSLSNKDIKLIRGINLIYGPNESGKTSLQEFIKLMLFSNGKQGRSKNKPLGDIKAHLPLNTDNTFGGTIVCISDTNDKYILNKDFSRYSQVITRNDIDYTDILDKDDKGAYKFAEKLIGVNISSFDSLALLKQINSDMSVGLNSDVQDSLTNIANKSSVRIDINPVLVVLDEQIKQVKYRPKASKGKYNKAQAEYAKLNEDINSMERIKIKYKETLDSHKTLLVDLEKIEIALKHLDIIKVILKYSGKLNTNNVRLNELNLYIGLLKTKDELVKLKTDLTKRLANLLKFKDLDYAILSDNISELTNASKSLDQFTLRHSTNSDAIKQEESKIVDSEVELASMQAQIAEIEVVNNENLTSIKINVDRYLSLVPQLTNAKIGRLSAINTPQQKVSYTFPLILLLIGLGVTGVSIAFDFYIGLIALALPIYAIFDVTKKQRLVNNNTQNVSPFRDTEDIKAEMQTLKDSLNLIFNRYHIPTDDYLIAYTQLANLQNKLVTLKSKRNSLKESINNARQNISLLKSQSMSSEISNYSHRIEKLKEIVNSKLDSLGLGGLDYTSALAEIKRSQSTLSSLLTEETTLASKLSENTKATSTVILSSNITEDTSLTSIQSLIADLTAHNMNIEKEIQDLRNSLPLKIGALPVSDLPSFLETNNNKLTQMHMTTKENLASCISTINLSGVDDEKLQVLKDRREVQKTLLAQYDVECSILEECKLRLQEAQTRFKQNYIPSIKDYAEQLLVKITDDKYDKLNITNNLEASVQSSKTGQSPLVLSKGTQDMLNIIMRGAILNYIKLSNGESIPILMDEVFSNIDEDRMTRILWGIKALSAFNQVIVFTCKRSDKAIFDTALGVEGYAYVEL